MNTGWKVNRHLEGFTGDPYDHLWENLVELEKIKRITLRVLYSSRGENVVTLEL
jgi:hypothetical protein